MKKESLSVMTVKTFLTVLLFAGIGTIIIGGGYIILEYYKDGMSDKTKWSEENSGEYLGGNFYKKDGEIYCMDLKVEGVDLETFKVLSDEESYAGYGFAKDKSHIYFSHAVCLGFECGCTNAFPVLGVDVDSFKIIKNEEEYTPAPIVLDKNNVYCSQDKMTIIKDADPATFEIIEYHYRRDKNYIFIECEKVENSDSESFEFLDNDSSGYAKDKNNVYYQYDILKGIKDSVSFEIVKTPNGKNSEFLSKDKYSVYRRSFNEAEKIKNADPLTFKMLDGGYAKDKNNVYYQYDILKGIDPSTFEILDKRRGYIKDKNNVYKVGLKNNLYEYEAVITEYE